MLIPKRRGSEEYLPPERKDFMDMTTRSCRDFVEALASDAPTPGGGGAAALAGAIATALGQMVGALTLGKPKYAAVEEEIRTVLSRCDRLQRALLDQVEADARAFLPLAAAYRIPKGEPGREQVLEQAALGASQVPLRIMELCCDALECIQILSQKGSRIMLSDAGCAAVLCKAALQAASIGVFVNTCTLKDRAIAKRLDDRANAMLALYAPMADQIFETIHKIYVPSES